MAFEIDPVEDLAAAVEWFMEAVPPDPRRPYAPPADRRGTERDLAELERTIAPLPIPPELAWLWRMWDPQTLGHWPFFDPLGPRDAKEAWETEAIELSGPRALLPIAGSGHGYASVDLTSPAGEPATVWVHGAGWTPDCLLEWPSIAAAVRASAAVVERADPSWRQAGDPWEQAFDLLDEDVLRLEAERRRGATGIVQEVHSDHDPAGWPDRWRSLEQVVVAPATAGAPSHSVVQFVAAADQGPTEAVMRGRLAQANGASTGPVVTFTDGTGSVALAASHEVLVTGWEKAAEVEVLVRNRGPLRSPPSTADVESVARDARATGSQDRDAWTQVTTELVLAMNAYRAALPVLERLVVTRI